MNKSEKELSKKAKIVAEVLHMQDDFAKISEITCKYFRKAGMPRVIICAVPGVDYKQIGNFPPVYMTMAHKLNDTEIDLDVLVVLISSYAKQNELNEGYVMQELSDRIIDMANTQSSVLAEV